MYKHDKEGHFILSYIIEDANVVSEQGILKRSYLIQENKISHFGKSLRKYQGMRMNFSTYFMTPGHTFIDFDLIKCDNLNDFKQRLVNLISKGCTTVLAPCYIPYELDFEKTIRLARHRMINSTIDFIIGVHMPAEKITPSIVRLCRRHKLPYIIAEINDLTNIHSIPWGWIRDAEYQFQAPIYPLWKIEDEKLLKMQMDTWEYVTSLHKIPTYLRFPNNSRPMPKVIQKQIGIYPKKGELLIGNDLDYNLYQYPEHMSKVEDTNKLDYDKIDPIITVHKGRLLKTSIETNFFPGYGEELKIKLPGLFSSN